MQSRKDCFVRHIQFLPRVILALISIATVSTWPHRPFVFLLGLSLVSFGSVSFVVRLCVFCGPGRQCRCICLKRTGIKKPFQRRACSRFFTFSSEARQSDLASERPASFLQASHEVFDLLLPLAQVTLEKPSNASFSSSKKDRDRNFRHNPYNDP